VKATFFKTPDHLRRWLGRNHSSATELWIGMYRKSSGKRGVTYREALDEALCFGWIDGVRKRLDEDSFVQRFTPRRPNSYWSAVNIKRAQELIEAGRMHPAGRAAFERRDTARAEKYSFERQNARLDQGMEKRFRANPRAWAFFESQPPGYRRLIAHWVTSAKKEETRRRRLEMLMKESASGRRVGLLIPKT
jgi:uncharacterized protein YdeI (YjbR/CyaY-like superfamily)